MFISLPIPAVLGRAVYANPVMNESVGKMNILSLAVSVFALSFSIYVFAVSRFRDRRDMFLKIHELLYSDDLQRGRITLFTKITDVSSVGELTDQEYRDVTRVLGAYNALGLYIRNGYVNERDVLNSWAESSYRAWSCAKPFREYRERRKGFMPWTNLDLLARKAEAALHEKGSRLPEIIDADNETRRRTATGT
jgi:hypothetical protein